jgi:protein KRI1
LAALKSQDPKIYNLDVKFFDDDDESLDATKTTKKIKDAETKTKSTKPMFLKDYERKVIVQHGGKFVDDDDEDDASVSDREDSQRPPNYFEEQESIRQSFKDAVASVDDDDNNVDELLTVRVKSEAEKAREEEDYLEWLKGQKDELSEDKDIAQELDPLRKYWTDPKLAEGERFLRDYLLNKQYLEEDDDKIPSYDEIIKDLEEDEKELDKEDEFEKKYNFRFEEPDSEFIKSYPRVIPETLRNRDTRRVKSRQVIRERKRLEKEKKREELKRLKNLKKKEIMEKIDKLKEIAGNTEIGFTADDVDGEFDEAQYDRMMKKVFDVDYYNQGSDDVKPVFSDDEDAVEDWDSWQPSSTVGTQDKDAAGADDEPYVDDTGQYDAEPYCEDPEFNMDADYDPSQKRVKVKKKKGRQRRHGDSMIEGEEEEEQGGSNKRKKSKFAAALERPKPVFDAKTKSFEEYFDEYYGLDYEDIIGDLPVRFKYRKVIPNDFGLSVDEVLTVPDKELNAWVSVKKMSQYRAEDEELRDLTVFRQKGRNYQKKLNILQSLREPDPESVVTNGGGEGGRHEKKSKKRKQLSSMESKERNDTDEKPLSAKRLKQETADNDDGFLNRTGKNENDIGGRKGSKSSVYITKPTDLCAGIKSNPNSSVNTELNAAENSNDSNRKTKKNKKKRKRNENALKVHPADSGKEQTRGGVGVDGVKISETAVTESSEKKKKKKKNKKKLPKISDERLKAYGINPKKFKYFHQKKLLQEDTG